MNVADFIHILQNANTILSPSQTRELEDIIEEYPYFQAARALHLKGLKNLDSYKYNNALKVTAAHTADRDVLFDYITSKEFIQNNIADTIAGRGAKLEDQEAVSEEIQPNPNAASMLTEAEEAALPQNLGDAEQILNPELFESRKPEVVPEKAGEETKETDLQLGKPLPFTKKEKHSFTEWLQLTSKGVENLNKIYFDLEKNIDNNEISVSNIYLNKIDKKNYSEKFYIIKNLQVLKSLIRKLIL